MSAYTFDAVSQYVIIGQNPEMADYDNPRGSIFGLSYAVRAADAHGNTWEMHVATGERYEDAVLAARTEKVAAALQARLDTLGKLPVGFDRWVAGRAVYGSAAWVEYGNDDELALERREAEEETLGF